MSFHPSVCSSVTDSSDFKSLGKLRSSFWLQTHVPEIGECRNRKLILHAVKSILNMFIVAWYDCPIVLIFKMMIPRMSRMHILSESFYILVCCKNYPLFRILTMYLNIICAKVLKLYSVSLILHVHCTVTEFYQFMFILSYSFALIYILFLLFTTF